MHTTDRAADPAADRRDLHAWLLEGDPALRWQVERDLLGADPRQVAATRVLVTTEGMGAALAAHQDADGQWAGGAYFPADASPDEPGQPWTATTWSLTSLREWGFDPAALRPGTGDLLARNARWEYEDLPYWGGEVDACINAMTLANALWLGRPRAEVEGLARWFVENEKREGGWNCPEGPGPETSDRASAHSTLNALKGLLALEQWAAGGDERRDEPRIDPQLLASVRSARHRGQEYLLRRRLRRRLRDGELIDPHLDESAYPMRWRCTTLNALTYFRAASLFDGVAPDPRLGESLGVLRSQRLPDGRMLQGRVDPGRVWFPLDVPEGEPSRWVTFLTARILEGWVNAPPTR